MNILWSKSVILCFWILIWLQWKLYQSLFPQWLFLTVSSQVSWFYLSTMKLSSSVSSCRIGVVEDLFCALILYHEPKIHTWCNFSSSRQVYTWALKSLPVYTCEKSYMYIRKITCVCKRGKNHWAPIPRVGEFHIKVTGFMGSNKSFATS